MDNKERAIELACEAYNQLHAAGVPEEFAPLVMSVAQANRGAFFGSFGSDTGAFIEFQNAENALLPVRLVFGIRRHRQPFASRIWYAIREAWAVFWGHDTEHEICLKTEDITQLRNLLRVLK
ncbi:MAG: hypothetical protein ACXAC5_01045 [Promethearchaeota archaeon]|jgi:hypothetical protein